MAAWPPVLTDLKLDLGVDVTDERDDPRLVQVLDAAVGFVERVRAGDFDFEGLVNVNTAGLTQLQTLTGVDATLAQAIVDGRPYGSVADVQAVVGDAVFPGIEDLVTVAPAPGADLVLGTLRLAGREHTRRRSPDGVVAMGDLGVGRVPTVDPDIDRLLGIGRFTPSRFA